MELPTVRHPNKDKRKKRKHHYKEYDAVVIKFYGERHISLVEKLEFSKDKYPTYKVRSVTSPGCVYYELELDDPDDPYCYVSSKLTQSLTEVELKKINSYANEYKQRIGKPISPKVKQQSHVVINLRADEKKQLKKEIQKQTAFINANKNFW